MCLFQYRLVVSTVCTLLFQCLTISVSDTDNRVEDNSPLHFTGGVKVLVYYMYVVGVLIKARMERNQLGHAPNLKLLVLHVKF